MIKTNYKVGDKVTISKLGKFFMLSGEILSNNPDSDKQLQIDLSPYGVWSFKYEDVQNGTITEIKLVETIKTESESIVSSENKSPVKRAYSKRNDKPKEVKQKRAYNRKKLD